MLGFASAEYYCRSQVYPKKKKIQRGKRYDETTLHPKNMKNTMLLQVEHALGCTGRVSLGACLDVIIFPFYQFLLFLIF